jgi:hypothetical protein
MNPDETLCVVWSKPLARTGASSDRRFWTWQATASAASSVIPLWPARPPLRCRPGGHSRLRVPSGGPPAHLVVNFSHRTSSGSLGARGASPTWLVSPTERQAGGNSYAA